MLSASFENDSTPVPVQHQNDPRGLANTFQYPVASGT